MLQRRSPQPAVDWNWSSLVADQEWQLYRPVLEAIQERSLPYMIAGGLAFSLYARRWRRTKDMDLLVLAHDRQQFIDLLRELGFEDYYAHQPYKRSWIYRAFREGVIVDVIWKMANDRADVDETWFAHAPVVSMRGLNVRVVSPEELIWAKMYVMHHDRCDWPDVLNILHMQADRIDWEHLLDRLGEDRLLLVGLLAVFRWLCPDRWGNVPEWVKQELGLAQLPVERSRISDQQRATLLDSYHDWFGPRDGG